MAKRKYYRRRKKKKQSTEATLAEIGLLGVAYLFYKNPPLAITLAVAGVIIFFIVKGIKKKQEENDYQRSDYSQQKTEHHHERPKQEFPTKRGEIVKSYGEQVIADYLFWRGINYEYERQITRQDGGVNAPDFYLPEYDVFIEYFGMMRYDAHYRYEMHMKFETFDRENWKVIKIYAKHITHKTHGKAISLEFKKLTGMDLPFPNLPQKPDSPPSKDLYEKNIHHRTF